MSVMLKIVIVHLDFRHKELNIFQNVLVYKL